MNTTTQKWGNSLAVRIPKHIVQQSKLNVGSPLTMHANPDGSITLTPVPQTDKLQDFVDKITPQNLPTQTKITELPSETW